MDQRKIDIERLSGEAEADDLERALEAAPDGAADAKLWTEQFAASGKIGKG